MLETLLATSSALALLIGAEGSAAAQCFYNNVPGGVDNTTAHNCISYNNGTASTGNAVNDTSGTLTTAHAYPPVNPGTATGISVWGSGTTLVGNIINSGTINAPNAGINIGEGATTGNGQGAGAVLSGSITNSGTIGGTIIPGFGIVLGGTALTQSTVTGSIINAAGGLIHYSNAGIDIGYATVGGMISNAGIISGTGSSAITILDSQIGNVGGNSIVNGTNATITATNAFAAIVLNGSGAGGTATATGAIVNNGTINGAPTIGIEVVEATAAGITNGGTINASYGIALTGKNAIAAVVTGNILNSGTINASAGSGIGIYSYKGGATVGGYISNSGTISATAATGIGLYGVKMPAGGVTNSGTITAANVGILLNKTSSTLGTIGSVAGGIVNQGTITAATGIEVTGGSTLVGGITNSGTGTINSSTNAINLTGEGGPTTIDINGGVVTGNIIGGGADTLNFAPTGTFTYNSSFSDVSAVNINSGTVVLNGGANSATTLTVSGGTLAGTGTIATAMTIASGVWAPGTPGTPGTAMTITGSATFNAASTYRIYLNPTTASLANISGTATLDGATVNAVFSAGSYVSKQYLILTSGGRVGIFNPTITNTNEPLGGSDSLSYAGNNVYLNLTSNYSSSSGLNGNQQAVANALTAYFNAHGGIPAQFFSLTPGQLTQVDGEVGTGAQTAGFAVMSDFLNLILDPSSGGGGSTGGGNPPAFAEEAESSLPSDVALAYAGILKAPPKPQAAFDQRWSAWGSGFGGSGTLQGDPAVGSNNVTASAYGVAGGMDYRYAPDTVLGFALAGAGTNWSLAQNLGGGRSDTFEAAVYAKSHAGPAYISVALAFANHWFTTNRIAVGDNLTAKFDGQSYAARVEAGYRYAVAANGLIIGVTPYAALQAQDFHTPSYSETDLSGGGFGLSYNAVNATDTRSELGARFDDLTTLNGLPLVLRGRLAWAHDWVSNPSLGAVFQALPGANFTVNGATPPPNSALATAAAELHLTANWTATAKFDGEFASHAQTYAGTGTVRYAW